MTPCADVPELMFTPGVVANEAAVRLCARCPIADRCRALGADEAWGVWGGVSRVDADGFLLAEMLEPAAVEVEHGKRGTGCTCLRCKAAHSTYVREWRERGRADVTGAERFEQQLAFEIGA